MITIKLRDARILSQQTGDIILTRGSGKFSHYNIIYQSTKGSLSVIPEFTHVLFCHLPGVYIEANISKKVAAFTYNDPNTSLDATQWRVLRKKGLTRQEQESLQNKAIYHLGKKYGGLWSEKSNRIFCSYYVAAVYNAVFSDLFEDPQKVYPRHFDELDPNEWEDVTKTYLEGTSEVDPGILGSLETVRDFLNYTFISAQQQNDVVEAVDALIETSNKVLKGYGFSPVTKKKKEVFEAHNWIQNKNKGTD